MLVDGAPYQVTSSGDNFSPQVSSGRLSYVRRSGSVSSVTVDVPIAGSLGTFVQTLLHIIGYPTCDTLLMTRLATEAVDRIFRPGFRYSKAEVLLMDLRQPGEFSEDLFALKQSVECVRLMQVMDDINERWGKGTMRAASVPATPDWGMRREMMSQSHTTRIDQLWTVKC